MSARFDHDPRTRLARQKYFTLRPKPLERWLWARGITASAERVFWLHWQEGQQRGDWCSEIPLRRVARECQLDVSTVTRAYQWLAEQGCLRRTDPGRDPANPFNQATAITEVRIPPALLAELDRHPNRRAPDPEPEVTPESVAPERAAEPSPPDAPRPADPFAGLRGRDRLRALARLTHAMSETESRAYREAQRLGEPCMTFDADSKLGPDERGRVLQFLASLSQTPKAAVPPTQTPSPTPDAARARRLSDFEIARLRRDLQTATSTTAVPELLRQIIWSVEEGALRRFTPVHALRIALKKIREGAWTRPHRLPPQWSRALGVPAQPETCRHA